MSVLFILLMHLVNGAPLHLYLFLAFFTINKMSFGLYYRPYVDNIIRERGKFETSVYRKATFSGVYTPFYSFLPDTCKIGMIYNK